MKRKNLFTSAVIITALSLSIGACLSGCGKQGVEPVMAATVEQQTLTYEVTTEEESVIETEEETESIQESSTDEAETESIQKSETDETISFIDSSFLKEPEQQQQQAQQSQDQTQQQPKAETPKESPQPPVVNPQPQVGDSDVDMGTVLPDGGVRFADGTEVHPGDQLDGCIFGGVETHGLY